MIEVTMVYVLKGYHYADDYDHDDDDDDDVG